MNITHRLGLFLLLGISLFAHADQSTLRPPTMIALWPHLKAPTITPSQLHQNLTAKDLHTPFMAEYLPKQSNHIAVLVISGGGYAHETLNKEGTPASLWLQKQGFTVYELIYRLPKKDHLKESRTFPFADGQRALRIIKSKQQQLGLRSIGVMGFSAGGHLAGMLTTQPTYLFYNPQDPIDQLSARPDFAVLLYPVISMQQPLNITHAYKSLFGQSTDGALLQQYSVNAQVTSNTAPVFLAHALDDKISPIENSLLLHQALDAKQVKNELVVFKQGGHGFGLGKANTETTTWPNQFLTWLKKNQF